MAKLVFVCAVFVVFGSMAILPLINEYKEENGL